MITLSSPHDYVHLFLWAALFGAVGGLAFELLQVRSGDTGSIELPWTRGARYFDLGCYAAQSGIPFTHSSNLQAALQVALSRYDSQQPFAEIVELSQWLRPKLRELGYRILAPECRASPAVITLALPPERCSQKIGDQLQAAGFLLSYQSHYLRQRNWIQICLMGDCSRQSLVALLTELRRVAYGSDFVVRSSLS